MFGHDDDGHDYKSDEDDDDDGDDDVGAKYLDMVTVPPPLPQMSTLTAAHLSPSCSSLSSQLVPSLPGASECLKIVWKLSERCLGVV